jgi:hypothetical protein|nr:MAG TPA: hypothetical protein [Caudoviricetes sp.]
MPAQKSTIVIIPNFLNMTISHKNMTISHSKLTISQPSIPAHFAVNIPFCLNPNLLNLSNIL